MRGRNFVVEHRMFPFSSGGGDLRTPLDETRGLVGISGHVLGPECRQRNHRLHFRAEMTLEPDPGYRDIKHALFKNKISNKTNNQFVNSKVNW